MRLSKPAFGYIDINNLKIYAYHGVDPQENVVGNYYEVNLKLCFLCQNAMRSDRLDHTINYADVVRLIEKEMSLPSRLLENVTYRIHTSLTAVFPQIISGEISIYKLNPPISSEIEKIGFVYRW